MELPAQRTRFKPTEMPYRNVPTAFRGAPDCGASPLLPNLRQRRGQALPSGKRSRRSRHSYVRLISRPLVSTFAAERFSGENAANVNTATHYTMKQRINLLLVAALGLALAGSSAFSQSDSSTSSSSSKHVRASQIIGSTAQTSQGEKL